MSSDDEPQSPNGQIVHIQLDPSYCDLSESLQEDIDFLMLDMIEHFGVSGGRHREGVAMREASEILGEGSQNRIRHEVTGTIVRSGLDGHVTEVITQVGLRGCGVVVDQSRVVDVLASFYKKVEELLHQHITSVAKEGDQAQVVILTDSLEHPISTSTMTASSLTPDHVLTKVQDAQTSEASIRFSDNLQIHFVLVKSDPAWLTVTNNSLVGSFPGKGNNGKTKYLLQWYQFCSKRSIIVIKSPAGECLASAIVRGLARLDYEHFKGVKVSKHRGGSELRSKKKMKPAEKVAYNLQENLRKNPNGVAMRVRREKLYKDAGVTQLKDKVCGDLEKVAMYEKARRVRIKVFAYNMQMRCVYTGSEEFGENGILHLLHSIDLESGEGHYDLITSITKFFSVRAFCEVCNVGYNVPHSHQCPDVDDAEWCKSCYDRTCGVSLGEWGKCESCGCSLRSVACAERHQLKKCDRFYFCRFCHGTARRPKLKARGVPDGFGGENERLMNDDEMERYHLCNMHWCRECEAQVDDDHLCFVKKIKPLPMLAKLMFFDFETRVDSSDEHVVNYVHAKYFKPSPPQPQSSAYEAPRSRFADMHDQENMADHTKWKGEWVEMSFAGDNALTEFLGALIGQKRRFRGYTVIAHNFRGFDGVLLLRKMLERNTVPNCILKGQKIMTMSISGCNIRFVDSYNFLPMALSKLPDAFGVPGEKGYFPYVFNVKENESYVGELPPAEYYGLESMSGSNRRKFVAWYEQQKALGVVFDMKKEIAAYCAQDVNILAESCLAYRKLMCEKTNVDPFRYITCASVCRTVFLSCFMEPGTIARVPPAGYSNARYSGEALEWLEYKRVVCGVHAMEHVANSSCGEKAIARYHADGYDPETRTVYEYHGCKFHGCPHCVLPKDPKARNPYSNKPLFVCYEKTKMREQNIRAMGFQVESIWGCQWKAMKDENESVRAFMAKMSVPRPLNPRDAFYGGRTEAFKLHKEGVMAYEDVTSLYPWVNYTKQYPLRHPVVIYPTEGDIDIEKYFGILKCRIVPPRDLYLPVLPMHVGPNRKLLFALCRKCAETFQVQLCAHSEEERMLHGTWFSEEIKLSLKKGYRLAKVEVVWHFEETSKQVFGEYVAAFYLEKVLSSKLPSEDPEEVKQFIRDVKVRDGISIKSADEFKENPGKRTLAKLQLNNLWGRFGMRENLTKSCFVHKLEHLVKLLSDPSSEVTGVRVITDHTVQVSYRAKSVDDLPMARDTNIFIAVTTTGWARMRLYEELDKLGCRAAYCDTDSVIYERSPKLEENLEIGPFLGQMTDELAKGDSISEFCSGGPKNYAYRTQSGNAVVKVKGFTLDAVNSTAFSFENLRKVILSGVESSVPNEGCGDKDDLRRLNSHVRRDRGDQLAFRQELFDEHLARGGSDKASAVADERGISCFNPKRIFRSRDFRVLKKAEQKIYRFYFDKRIVLENYDTVPYGYVGPVG